MRTGGLERAAFRWGVKLGLGVSTYVVTPALYAMLVVATIQSSPVRAISLCALYGVARGATIVRFALVQRDVAEGKRSVPGVGLERMLRLPLTGVAALAAALAVL
jgi:hypothetical protein